MVKSLRSSDRVYASSCTKPLQMPLLFVFLFCLTVSFLFACSEKTPPSELLGVWKTSDGKYSDRYVEITRDSLIFGIGEDRTMVHAITGVSSETGDQGIRYTFDYVDQNGEQWTLSLLYGSRGRGTMALQNRDELWIREEQP